MENRNRILPTEVIAPRRVQAVMTPRGVILAALGVALFMVGLWRIDGVMASLGLAALGMLVVARIVGGMNLTGLDLHGRADRRVQAGRSFPAKVSLMNRRRGLDAFRVEFGISMLGEADVMGRASWVGCGGVAEVERGVTLQMRGFSESQKGWLKSFFPLGLFDFQKVLKVGMEIGVLPAAVVPQELSLSGFLLDGSPLGGSKVAGALGEWKGLREWRGGDAVKRIAWAASARSEAAGRGVLVREDEPPGSHAEGFLLIFHSYGGDGELIRPDRFEKALMLFNGTLGVLQGLGMPVRWVADFDGWNEHELRTKQQLAVSRELLMKAKRAAWTEAHDMESAFFKAVDRECVVVISDMPCGVWQAVIPEMSLAPVLVDASRYDRAVKAKGGAR